MAQKKPGKVLFQGIEAGMKVFRWMVLALVILFLVSGLAKVQPTHIGILTRFGKLVPVSPENNIHEPGFVLAFPYPIDQLIQIPKDQEQQIEVTTLWAPLDDKEWNDEIDPTIEGYCLTAENDVIQAKVVVKYKISDPVEFEFNMINPNDMIESMTVAALTECIASWKFDDVQHMNRIVKVPAQTADDGKEATVEEDHKETIAEDEHKEATVEEDRKETIAENDRKETTVEEESKETIAKDEHKETTAEEDSKEKIVMEERKETLDELVKQNLQMRLDAVGKGKNGLSAIQITKVEFVDVHHLRHVKADFENKQTAEISVQVAMDEANKQANRLINEAKTQKNQLVNNAKIYSQQRRTEAIRNGREYLPKLKEYLDAPQYVWQREYLNAMENVWTNVGALKFVPANSRVVLQDEEEAEQQ